jgi:xanthine dehydrogenase accessory factor
MRDVLPDYERLADAGAVGRAVVTRVWGSAPRTEGANLIATADGRMAGSVSGGCVEGAVVEAITEAMSEGKPRLLDFTVTHERAWEVGLACGGSIGVFVEPAIRPELLEAARGPGGVVVASVIGGAAPLGRPDPHVAAAVADEARSALASLACRVATVVMPAGEVSVFLEVFPKQPTLFIIGAVHIAESLCQLARPLGYRTVVADGRAAFLTRDRFPDADLLVEAWPEEAFKEVGIDDATCVCILSHDPKFDEPALDAALRSPAAYIGAIGSRKTQEIRRERLKDAGFSPEEVARLHGPIGLDLGGRHPGEIALAILAEITAVRHGKRAGRRESKRVEGGRRESK